MHFKRNNFIPPFFYFAFNTLRIPLESSDKVLECSPHWDFPKCLWWPLTICRQYSILQLSAAIVFSALATRSRLRLVVVGNNNRIYIWRKKDEAESRDCVCPPAQRRLSVMIWGCISHYGVGTITTVTRLLYPSWYKERWTVLLDTWVSLFSLNLVVTSSNGVLRSLRTSLTSPLVSLSSSKRWRHLCYDNVFLNLLFLK
jgi:hypothetical protein